MDSGPETPGAWREEPGAEPTPAQPAAEAAQILEQALAQVESMLEQMEQGVGHAAPAEETQELAELRQALREVVRRLEDALGHLHTDAQRLSNETARLTLVADRLETGLSGLSQALRQGAAPAAAEPTAEPAGAEEPLFRPGDHAVGIVIAAVPGFQGLMDVQRGLSDLPTVEGASVSGYRNGEASLEVVLRAPVSARQIVEKLRESTGHQLLIEEARPDASRLRLRFSDQEGRS